MGEETREAMASLSAMGFTDVDRNLAVLQKHSTIEAALDELRGSEGGAQAAPQQSRGWACLLLRSRLVGPIALSSESVFKGRGGASVPPSS